MLAAGITISTDPVQDVIAALLLISTILSGLNHRQGRANAARLDEVHDLTNANLTDARHRQDVSEQRVTQLIDTAANAAAEATIKRATNGDQ